MLEHIWPPHIITSRKITIHPGPELAVEGTLAEGRVCTARGVAWEDLPPGGKLMYAGTSHAGLPGVREILQHTCLSSSAAKCLTKKKDWMGEKYRLDKTRSHLFLISHVVYLYPHSLVLLWTLPTTFKHWTMSEKHTRAMSNKNNMINYLLQDINYKF